jgi:hypothetical protein
MKKSIITKVLAATLVLTVATTAINFAMKTTVAYATSYPDGTGGVWNTQVVSYLQGYGYENIVIVSIDQYGNRTCTSSNHIGYNTVVYVSGGRIVDHQDIPQNF